MESGALPITGPVRVAAHGYATICNLENTGIIGLPQVGKDTLFKILRAHNWIEEGGRAATPRRSRAELPEPGSNSSQKAVQSEKDHLCHGRIRRRRGGMVKDRKKDSAVLAPMREVDARPMCCGL